MKKDYQYCKITDYWCYGKNEEVIACPICNDDIITGKVVIHNNTVFHYDCWKNKNRKGNTMKTKIENKLNEIAEYIISKSPEDITYNEYRILDNRLAVLRSEEMQKTRDKEMAEMLGKLWSGGYSNCLAPQRTLPESNDEK